MPIDTRAMLIHVTHIDPIWLEQKDREMPFDLATAMGLLPAMAESGMNTVIVDVEDGVRYASHPEMARHYSVPIEELRTLADEARRHWMDVIPKLNFAKSGRNFHDMWMRPHWHHVSWLQGIDEYYAVAHDVIAELIDVMGPTRFFHLGMDEDHFRSLPQYVETIGRLGEFVRGHGLRPVVWNDSCHDEPAAIAQVHAEKCRAAEEHLSKDIVHVLWDYGSVHAEKVGRIAGRGFDVWAAPGPQPEQVAAWSEALTAHGGSGLVLTCWIKCCQANRQALLDVLRTAGPGYLEAAET